MRDEVTAEGSLGLSHNPMFNPELEKHDLKIDQID